MRINYRISDVADYINWVYFFHAWSVPPHSAEGERLKEEAERMLRTMQKYVKVKAAVEILPAYSEDDDIVVQKTYLCECGLHHPYGDPIRLPMLRQQVPGADGYCLCLSDFVRPQTPLKQDRVGVFAVTVSADVEHLFPEDDYNKMLLQTLADRLAEAGAERLHQEVRKNIWGYAPNENLTIEELHSERFQGIRPAVGYPCLPDVSLNFVLDEVLNFKSIGVTLTEHGMMRPHASVSGLMIAHPQSRYFSIGKIDEQQLADYAKRRGLSLSEAESYLRTNLG